MEKTKHPIQPKRYEVRGLNLQEICEIQCFVKLKPALRMLQNLHNAEVWDKLDNKIVKIRK